MYLNLPSIVQNEHGDESFPAKVSKNSLKNIPVDFIMQWRNNFHH